MGINTAPSSLDGSHIVDIPQVFLAQIEGTLNLVKIFTALNPFLSQSSQVLETLEKSVSSMREQFANYNLEENILSLNPLSNTLNGLNNYHVFLEGQKARKLILEESLTSLKILQTLFPFHAPFLQQTENLIRANLAFTFTFHRPEWNLDFENETIESLDFVDVVKFPASLEKSNGRNMLLVAPMSGHFSTLLRKTIHNLHDEGYTVFITDWKSPFDVAKDKGDFTIDRYTQEILNTYQAITQNIGDGEFDVLAVCQPGPETMTATAYAEQQKLPKPRSITLMASPIDVSKSPTAVNTLSSKLTPDVLDRMKVTIPGGKYEGAGRSVYPAPLQIASFISANLDDHWQKFQSLAFKTTPFDEKDEKVLAFYREYFAVMDLPHEFYKETVQRIFQSNEWANGKVAFKGEIIDFSQMKTPLVTIEGEEDDICGIGQTSAAYTISPNVEKYLHISLPGAGHYGTFAGKPFREVVIPQLNHFYSSLEK